MGKISSIVDILKSELDAGLYPVGSRFPSEYDLSERFGVGRVTVNKAVSELVTLGRLTRGVRGSGTRVRAVSVYPKGHVVYLGQIADAFFSRVLLGVMNTSMHRDYGVEVAYPEITELEGYLDRIASDHRYVGIVTNSYGIINQERWSLPIVYVDYGTPEYDPELNHVVNNNQKGARKLAEELFARGHKEVVIYTNRDYLSSHRFYRVNGFLEAMTSGEIENPSQRLFVGMEYSQYDAAVQLKQILRKYPATTAILTATDNLAQYLARALQEMPPEIQKQITVCGFGNVSGISDAYHLPSVEQHPFHLGVNAVNSLLDKVESKNFEPTIHYVDAEPVNLEYIPKLK